MEKIIDALSGMWEYLKGVGLTGGESAMNYCLKLRNTLAAEKSAAAAEKAGKFNLGDYVSNFGLGVGTFGLTVVGVGVLWVAYHNLIIGRKTERRGATTDQHRSSAA